MAVPASLPVAPRTAAITNLGCKVNQAEMTAAARLLRDRGLAIVDDRAGPDLVLVNTCSVTGVADAKSRQAVRRARRANGNARILVTGCAVQVDRASFATVDPLARLVDNDAKATLLAELDALVGLDRPTRDRPDRALPTMSGVDAVGPAASIEGIADERTVADRTRAFIKVQDGCSFYCTYCIIPRARGPERSLEPAAVLADIRRATGEGRREIVLTGINIGTYDGGWSMRGPRGSHSRSTLTLAGLLRRITTETSVERIRLSSIEPQHVDRDLLRAWSDATPRTMPDFHLPLQSGDNGVLRRMGRRYDSAGYAATVERIRAAIPGAAIHADVIAGFPTEDDAAFERSVAFIERLDLAGLHVFRYSARPGTPATRMAGQVDEATRKRRAARLLALASEARARRVATRIGSTASVLFEARLPDRRWIGHAEDRVLVAVPAPVAGVSLDNVVAPVRIEESDPGVPDRAIGTLIEPAWRPA